MSPLPRQLTLIAVVDEFASAQDRERADYRLRRTELVDELALAELYLVSYASSLSLDRDAAVDEMEHTFGGEYGHLDLEVSPVVTHDERVVGAVVVVDEAPWPDTPPGPFIIEVMVDPAHRRRGLATTALRWMFAGLASRGARVVALRVMSDNAAALALYDRLGFVEWRNDESGSHDVAGWTR